MCQRVHFNALWLAVGLASLPVAAQDLAAVEVRDSADGLDGMTLSASEGVISSARLAGRPLSRPAEVLEMVPGLVVTQHAGEGKANQYSLRGFNLDHGTDFATYVGGVPVNMPTHAHGQGYTDLNFLIPELVDRIHYRKGPYDAEEGDFASAGSARIDYVRRLDRSLAQTTLGANGYVRTLLSGAPNVNQGQLLYGLELFHHDGPWLVPENYRKFNGVLRYSDGSALNGFSLTGMAYRGQWVSTDQVAQRAVDSGLVDRYGSLDSTTGGRSHRYSLALEWARQGQDSLSKTTLWWQQSDLNLASNFQYCLDDMAATGSCSQGDQFQQTERRQALGGSGSHLVATHWQGWDVSHSLGWQMRADRIAPLVLYKSSGNTLREDSVRQYSLGLWGQTEVRWTPWLRGTAGLRADVYRFDVDASLAANSGRARDHMVSPKLGLVLGPWRKQEFYVNWGHGFHSNDARGATITVDPANPGTAAQRVSPLVKTIGYELGWRGELRPGWHSTLAFWHLSLGSELLFVGDAGTTEAARPSSRHGIEWSHVYALNRHWSLDADLSWTEARFSDNAPEGNFIPGAVSTTANLGLSLDRLGPWSMALRLRYLGPRPLIENNTVRSEDSLLANLRVSYRVNGKTSFSLDVLNLCDRRVNDVEYWYASQLRGEAVPVFDRHVHPAEPRTVRLTWVHQF